MGKSQTRSHADLIGDGDGDGGGKFCSVCSVIASFRLGLRRSKDGISVKSSLSTRLDDTVPAMPALTLCISLTSPANSTSTTCFPLLTTTCLDMVLDALYPVLRLST